MSEELTATKIKKAYNILKNYTGENNQILLYKKMYDNGKFELNDFSYKYITSNNNYIPIDINKTVRIS